LVETAGKDTIAEARAVTAAETEAVIAAEVDAADAGVVVAVEEEAVEETVAIRADGTYPLRSTLRRRASGIHAALTTGGHRPQIAGRGQGHRRRWIRVRMILFCRASRLRNIARGHSRHRSR